MTSSEGERTIDPSEGPLTLSVLHLLYENKLGLTASELTEQLHMSVPTLYRLTLEMHQESSLIVNERKDRRNLFKISRRIATILPPIYTKFESTIDVASLTKSILKNHNLSLSSRVAEIMVFSKIKREIYQNMPKGTRGRISDVKLC